MNRANNNININRIFYQHGIDPANLPKIKEEVLSLEYYDGKFLGNYTTAFKVMVSRLISMVPIPDLKFRNKAVKVLTDAYILQVGEAPNGLQLTLLANWILADILRNTHPDKVTKENYPILNKGQLKARHIRERVDMYIEGYANEKK
ncbi:hypothetical protein [Alkaliphilus peptidifermentans]|uniref:Uncharacterized protein n=1 Tax=Alkaliphilus peptidifermentans DSM 18978 TaxID=1120976 RepID=A0A1G5JL01_9FIRM|nr:hypothetical protein [Alkaliphilus peptidifermentans]SCY88419.1 hypothetical protein SAMN03080606_02873 [Alkaliphilus peptidifermentans DSM 18978]